MKAEGNAAITPALREATALIAQQRFTAARDLLEPYLAQWPRCSDLHRLLGVALRSLGEHEGAERALRMALTLDPLGQDTAIELARLLAASGRHAELVEATEAQADSPHAPIALLVERAKAFQALERTDERVATRARIAALQPTKITAHHNLAAALGDAGHADRAEASARSAMALGGDAPETWLVLGRALQGQGRYADAEAAFRQAVHRRPSYADALRDLSQLVWMCTSDLGAALDVLDDAVSRGGDAHILLPIRAKLFEFAGDPRAGYDLLMREGLRDPGVEMMAAHLALNFDPQYALAHARRAEALAPRIAGIDRKLIEVLLAAGQPAEALARIERLLASGSDDQALLAAQWTAWRMLGDPRAGSLYDYQAFVLAQTIDTPEGWDTLDAFLHDLARTMTGLHQLQAHPLDQSLRHGTQTSANLLTSDDTVIQAFRRSIDGPIRRMMTWLGEGMDPLRSRNSGDYRLAGMWSVRLRSGGFHVNHVHPKGWLSSACYISVPQDTDADRREGWIKFGEPAHAAGHGLGAEHFVKPEPGRLVMFPSYMWHGTIPFSGPGHRLTMAFDVIPA